MDRAGLVGVRPCRAATGAGVDSAGERGRGAGGDPGTGETRIVEGPTVSGSGAGGTSAVLERIDVNGSATLPGLGEA